MKSKTLVTHQVWGLMQRVSATYNLTSALMSDDESSGTHQGVTF